MRSSITSIRAVVIAAFFLSGSWISAASAQNSTATPTPSDAATGRDAAQIATGADSPAVSSERKERSPWSFEPAIVTGYVYEFTQLARPYTGWEIAAGYDARNWLFRGRYRAEKYVISYFGVSQEAVRQIFSGQPLSMPFLSRVDVGEDKTDEELLAGYAIRDGRLNIYGGARSMRLKNAFSSIDTSGPAVRVDGRWDAGWTPLFYRIDGAFFLRTTIENHAANIYHIPAGERSISFAGEPRGLTQWELSINPFPKTMKSVSLRYEGSVIFLKYSYRYSHGLAVQAAF